MRSLVLNSRRKKKINMFSTSVVIFISVLLFGVVCLPRFFGYKTFYIETGSMEPTLKTGSLVYVETGFSFEKYQINDIVTFMSSDMSSCFTHRIVGIDRINQNFTTRGDANQTDDPDKISASLAVGKVQFCVPILGYVASALDRMPVRIAVFAIYAAWLIIEIELFLAERKMKNE